MQHFMADARLRQVGRRKEVGTVVGTVNNKYNCLALVCNKRGGKVVRIYSRCVSKKFKTVGWDSKIEE